MISLGRAPIALVAVILVGCTPGFKDNGNMYGVACDSKSEPVAECAR